MLNGVTIPVDRNPDKEIRLATAVRSRLTKVEAPDAFRPCGRFKNLADALEAFQALRRRTIEFVQPREDALYAVGVKHPFFGKLNGVELLGIIDAHARRHADQIREACLTTPPVDERRAKRRAKSRDGAQRNPPDLPSELKANDGAGQLFADGELVVVQDRRVAALERPNLRVKSFGVEGSALERVRFAGGQFGSIVWKDVRIVGCDFANVRAHRMELLRVELIDCRLTGLSGTGAHWRDVLIQNGDLRYAQLQRGVFRNCEFTSCDWQDADLQNADLTGAVFRSCRLGRADLNGAALENADFRGSELDGMLVGLGDLRGAIVDAAQAMVLAQLLGLRIA
jgi:uncharacterized protein YjbI with pentapeptide repeats